MNLLSLLLGGLTSQNSVSATSKKSGVSSKLTSKLLMMAIPMLISYLTKNASKKDGAQSLLGALTQHTSKDSVEKQIENADTVDGAKIIAHILGNDQNAVLSNLAKESGASVSEVSSVLNSIAPALLNSLGTATNATSKKVSSGVDLSDGIDLSDVMGLLGNVSGKQNNPSVTDVLGSLLNNNASNKKQDNPLDITNMVGSLLGGTSNKKTSSSQVDGTELLTSLLSLMK